ncbi:threonine/serine dehydratase [Nocardiopsis tropica]|jgi:threonine dehydratase|uniref:Threonine/serine dehydratase n=1 Tax=Nocardiopsis tropica TaxID=109330 RepID=A0ABU7KSE3_9ACTN|nr:threonine/serine dehydratase [Nocardiopsis umidischolae]MEE2052225.1 threonine/serine dehydratase [Nocardiopsis umidischolae]
MELVTADDVRAAATRLQGHVVRTPLTAGPPGADFLLKPESLQPTGAFKIRGATNAVALLDPGQRRSGVVTHSSGNHGQALALAAVRHGAPCTVVVPEGSPEVKVDRIRALGARVVMAPPREREAVAGELARSEGLALIPPFDDPDVIAGQGTVGLEILEQSPEVTTVVVPVGGGGLASGVSTAAWTVHPRRVRVIGVEPELAADAAESLSVGHPVTWPSERTGRTMADGVRVGLSERTFAHLAARLDGIVTVTEDEIARAVGVLAHGARVVAEPSGALAAAALLAGRIDTVPGRPEATVAVVSGGNADPGLFARLVAQG